MGIGVSIFFLAVGAILAFAVNVQTEGIELDTVGVILMILGLVGLLASLMWSEDWPPRRADRYEDRDVVYRRRRPRVVTVDDDDYDGGEDRPGEGRRVTTRRSGYDGG